MTKYLSSRKSMPQSKAAHAKLILLCALIGLSTPVLSGDEKPAQTTGPDLAAKQFRFDDLRAMLGTMPGGPEHDYFAGLLANAENRINESIQLLTSALPILKASRVDRAAI